MPSPFRALPLLTAAILALAVPAPVQGAPAGLGFQLENARVTPGEPLLFGKHPIKLRYSFSARRPVDLTIRVVRSKSGNTVRTWRERDAAPGRMLQRSWDGLNRRGKALPDGRYEFRLKPAGERDRFAAGLQLRGHVFPVDGPHGTRGAVGEFNAPRSGGRIHEGFDVTGDCGTPLVAARGGEIEKAGFDPVLYGNYVRIDAAKSDQDYFYAHLIDPSAAREGERVYTGERLGEIGQTGNAAGTPCHLHFEVRVGGTPIDPEPLLNDWDR